MSGHTLRRAGGLRRLIALGLVAFVILSVASAGALSTSVLAQDDGPPEVPAAYYGEVVIDGEPAPEGTIVTAVVDGEERGSITVGADGRFGGASVGDEKLEVHGDSDDAGEPVTFLVNGVAVDAEPAVTWESGAHQEITLTGSDVGELAYEISIDESESTTEIRPNNSATVAAVVENTGDVSGPTTVAFSLDGGAFDGDVVAKRSVEVAPGESTTIPFAVRLDEEGEYDATVALENYGSASTVITVDESAGSTPPPILPPAPPDPANPNLQVTAATLSETSVSVGDSVTTEATVENLGEAEGTTTVSLTVDGDEVASDEVTIAGGAMTSLSFDHAFDESGSYHVAVGGTSAGTVTVEDPSDGGDGTDGEDGTDDGDGIPGFGALGAIGALLVTVLRARRSD